MFVPTFHAGAVKEDLLFMFMSWRQPQVCTLIYFLSNDMVLGSFFREDLYDHYESTQAFSEGAKLWKIRLDSYEKMSRNENIWENERGNALM